MKKIRCPRCKYLINVIVEHMNSILCYTSNCIDGINNAGPSMGVYGSCEECGHEWKLRGYCQMTDELKKILKHNQENAK